jgi:hypothetical protein
MPNPAEDHFLGWGFGAKILIPVRRDSVRAVFAVEASLALQATW